jgi:hypothetical protein
MSNLVALYAETGRTDEAVKWAESSLDLFRQVSGPAHQDTLNGG